MDVKVEAATIKSEIRIGNVPITQYDLIVSDGVHQINCVATFLFSHRAEAHLLVNVEHSSLREQCPYCKSVNAICSGDRKGQGLTRMTGRDEMIFIRHVLRHIENSREDKAAIPVTHDDLSELFDACWIAHYLLD